MLVLSMAMLCLVANAQNKVTTEKLIAKYKGKANFTTISMPASMLAMASGEMDPETAELMKSVDVMRILVNEAATAEYVAEVAAVTKGMIPVMNVNSEGEEVAMYIDKDSSCFIMVVNSDSDHVILELKGENFDAAKMMKISSQWADKM